jgi:hypothetical protein
LRPSLRSTRAWACWGWDVSDDAEDKRSYAERVEARLARDLEVELSQMFGVSHWSSDVIILDEVIDLIKNEEGVWEVKR